jgi:serine/threonine protein kinase
MVSGGPPYAPEHKDLGEIIRRCTAGNPAARFETVRAIRDALVDRCRHTLVLEADVIQAPAGTVLGQWELLEVLGEGAIGTVFRARHLQLGRQAALKVMRPEHVTNARLVKRFRDEARAVNHINHPHIVQIVDLCESSEDDGTSVYCVMELLHGCTLESLLASETPSVARTVSVGMQVCEALAAAHAVGVIHRDIKPANIFLVEPGERDFVKLLDFGVAKLRLASTEASVEISAERTAQGALLGTPTYMSPEQASSEEIDARTDLYALGTTLYRMLAGHLPFGGPSFGEFLKQVLNDAPTPMPRTTLTGEVIPPVLRELVMQCLAKSPAARPESAAELRTSLRRCAGRNTGAAKRWLWVCAAAVLLADTRPTSPAPPPPPVPTATLEITAPPRPSEAAAPQAERAQAPPPPEVSPPLKKPHPFHRRRH